MLCDRGFSQVHVSVSFIYTVELQWLGYFLNHKSMFKTVIDYGTREGTCEFYFLTCSDDLICCSNDLISCLHNLSSCSNDIIKLL